MLIVMPPLSSNPRGGHSAIRRSSIDPIDIELRIAAINVLQKQDEVDDKSHAASTTRGSPTGTSYTGRLVPHFPGEDFPDPLTALTALETQSMYAVEDCASSCGATHASICTLTPTGPAREAHMMQLHAMKHYPLIDQFYFSQQECYLNKTILKWEFDVLKLEESSAQGVLKDVGLKLCDVFGLVDEFDLSLVSLHQTFQLIQASYHNNPYHNAAHAADVVQAACCLVAEKKISKHMTKLEHLAMIMAGACHDLDHPGVNQAFLKTTNHYLTEAAKRYPDSENTSLDVEKKSSSEQLSSSDENVMSVLEIHHIRHAAAIFDQTQIFAHFSQDQYLELLKLIKELILATDMAFQGRYMEKLKRLNKEYNSLETDEERSAFFKVEDTRRFYLQVSLKCADICNTCRPWEVSQKWSRRVTEEFFAQGDKERVLSLPINEINDRYRTTIEKVQVGFLKFVARPLFAEWDSVHLSDLSKSLLRNIDNNLLQWSRVQQHQEKLQTRSCITKLSPMPSDTASATSKSSAQPILPPTHHQPVPHLPPMPSSESLHDRQYKPHPPDGISETASVRLDVIGEANDEESPEDVQLGEWAQPKQRKPSIPCAFVSLDHSVAIIKDNLRQQAVDTTVEPNAETSSPRHKGLGKEKKVSALPEASREIDSSNSQPQGTDRNDHSAAAVAFGSLPINTTGETGSRIVDLDGVVGGGVSKHIESSSDTIELPSPSAQQGEDEGRPAGCSDDYGARSSPSFSVYTQFKPPRPQSELLESVPSLSDKQETPNTNQINHLAHVQQQQALEPTDYEAELLARLKYHPFDASTVAEVQKLTPQHKRRIEELSKMENVSRKVSKPHHDQTASVVKSTEDGKVQSESTKTVIGSTVSTSDGNEDLTSYAKLTSPPPYRKSIMLTVDKSLEKLRADHAAKGAKTARTSTTSQSAANQCVKATQVTVYESATLHSPRPTSTHQHQQKQKQPNLFTRLTTPSSTASPSSRPPHRTISTKSENLLPSSDSPLQFESITPGYSSSSMASPEMPRSKIIQSRSNFFKSLLKSSAPEMNHLGGSSILTSSHSPRSAEIASSSSPFNFPEGTSFSPLIGDSSISGGSTVVFKSAGSPASKDLDVSDTGPSKPRKALDQELEALQNGPEMLTESPCNITSSEAVNSEEVSSSAAVRIHIENEDTNQGRRLSRTLVQDTKAAKRSQSASARLAKTFHRLFHGGSSSRTAAAPPRSHREHASDKRTKTLSSSEKTVESGSRSSNLLSPTSDSSIDKSKRLSDQTLGSLRTSPE
ncbi:uncharacterized protein LOC134852151 isoform X3 [Symsagittifera roscoffensis]|uniref:uncharacterized protein LOC134852151 isoform X3 n=1 Tax=Symsagittifera roscoffensis TaxID=84072 RepID=UPI00307B117C